MVNRVVLDKDGMRVSRAGVDVLNAAEIDLTFNSRWPTIKALQTGDLVIPAPSSPYFLPEVSEVTFSRVFDTRPIVFFNVRGSSWGPAWRQHIGETQAWLANPSRYQYRITVQHDRFIFTNFAVARSDGGRDVQPYSLKYFVWDHNV
ncbi:hypothetical protein JF546_07910 [Nitratireductor aquimarinus]|uniref:hypothetical protein n=1 Tax=Nitratireductor aquimarinus TaxID=889300 RepID=UPI001A8C2A79|nr:hypothetical protein [Nitratireductor aquimarinus]MBN8242930.1 hypothetical protein [Nitratireductor aquimarinus]MBY6132031.1 hypothetical protein [Nitratireductor aquimarinus]MCA1301567.1 hypothetical protein [Nitratireductor aquimarinus]